MKFVRKYKFGGFECLSEVYGINLKRAQSSEFYVFCCQKCLEASVQVQTKWSGVEERMCKALMLYIKA